jgi:DNA-binding NarL/FixJ family response regulator
MVATIDCEAAMNDVIVNSRSRRVLIADPQPVFRLGLVSLLALAYPDWDIIESDTLEEQRLQFRIGSIDLLIGGSRLFGTGIANGLSTGSGINPSVAIVAVTEPGDAMGVLGCLGAGAHATASRADPATRMLATIEALSKRHWRGALARDSPRLPEASPAASLEAFAFLRLTARQLDVLRLLAKGQSNKAIARDLGLSVSTVKVHLNTLFRALGARNRVEAAVQARPFWERMLQQQSRPCHPNILSKRSAALL